MIALNAPKTDVKGFFDCAAKVDFRVRHSGVNIFR